MPFATVLTEMINFLVQFALFIVFVIIYARKPDSGVHPNLQLILLIDHLFFLLNALADALRHGIIGVRDGGKLFCARGGKLFAVAFQRFHFAAQLSDRQEKGLKDQKHGQRKNRRHQKDNERNDYTKYLRPHFTHFSVLLNPFYGSPNSLSSLSGA
jgi:hypothetical protein